MDDERNRWAAAVVLGDGESAFLRPIEPSDAAALRAFHERQPSEAQYRRFFSPKPTLSDAELRHFTEVDFHDRVALVLELRGEFVAWASYERWQGRPDADVAFMVDTDQRGKGIATLLLAMENHRGKFAVIVAGYPEEMKFFLDSNPGLRSRFDQTWHFRDYTNDELIEIVHGYVEKNDFVLADGCDQRLREVFDAVPRNRFFANARLARETFQAMRRRQAARIVGQGLSGRAHLMLIQPDDIVPPTKARPRPPMGFTAQG